MCIRDRYTAFGNDVPPAIAKLFNMSDLNFQGCKNLGQHEPPFWFCETPGEVSRQLNAIINLDVIDRTQSNLASKLRDANAEIIVIKKRLSNAIEDRKGLAYIKQASEDFTRIEGLDTEIQENARIRVLIGEQLKLGYNYALERENALKRLLDAKLPLSVGRKWEVIGIRVKTLSKLVESGRALQSQVDARPPSIKPLRLLKTKLNDISQERKSLRDLITEIKNKKELKCQMEEDVRKFGKELREITGQNCPFCGKPMK